MDHLHHTLPYVREKETPICVGHVTLLSALGLCVYAHERASEHFSRQASLCQLQPLRMRLARKKCSVN